MILVVGCLKLADHIESKKWAMDEYGMAKPYYTFYKSAMEVYSAG